MFSVLVVDPGRESLEVRQNRTEFMSWVGLINHKYGREVVAYEERGEQDLQIVQRMAYFAAADLTLMINSP